MPMRPDSYPEYAEASIAGYAEDNVRAGRWAEASAVARARADFASLLPKGLDTPDHFLFEILEREGGPVVGAAWLWLDRSHHPVTAYVYDIGIHAEYRRQGHALRALQALEATAAAAGAVSIGLNVFANNAAAQGLYRKLGYAATHFSMSKPLRRSAATRPSRVRVRAS
jgi:ribosomal protein S18 acetylase RimI-like enzyme